jgi:hypothetical protein
LRNASSGKRLHHALLGLAGVDSETERGLATLFERVSLGWYAGEGVLGRRGGGVSSVTACGEEGANVSFRTGVKPASVKQESEREAFAYV